MSHCWCQQFISMRLPSKDRADSQKSSNNFLFSINLQALGLLIKHSFLALAVLNWGRQRKATVSSSRWSLLRLRQLSPSPSVLTLSFPFSSRQRAISVSWAISGDQQGWKKLNVKDVYFLIAGESVLVGLRLQPTSSYTEKEWATERGEMIFEMAELNLVKTEILVCLKHRGINTEESKCSL